MNIFKRRNLNKFLIFSTFFGLFFFFFLPIKAMVISQIYFIDFNIEKTSFRAGEEIRGDFTLWNYEKQVVPDITYSYKLMAEDSSGFFTIVLDEKFSGDSFSLGPDRKTLRSFNYRLPQNLPSGNHRLRIQLYSSKGMLMSRKDTDISVQSDNRFLTLENHFILKEGQRLSPGGAAILDPGETAQASFDVLNKSSFQISASPKVTFYYYNINENPLRVIDKRSITLVPGQTQNQTIDLIGFQEPGSYFCRVVMYQANNIISNSIDFRWTVSGKEMEIAQIRTDETSYQAGEEATITVDAGYKDSLFEKEGDLEIKIMDEKGNIIGETRQTIDLKEGSSDVRVPITEDIHFPRVEITVIGEEEKILDRYETQLKSDEPKEEQVEERDYFSVFALIVLIGIIILIIKIILEKRSLSFKVLLFAILFLTGVLGVFFPTNFILAAESFSSGPGDSTAIAWSEPPPFADYFYSINNYVQLSGHVQTVFFDELRYNEIQFFIAKPGQVVLKDHDTGINIIQVIDEDNSEVIKIGELIYPNDYQESVVDYNEILKIPNIPDEYLGKVWLFVQFKGQNFSGGTGSNWHWIIAYQEATIQTEEEGGLDLTLSAEEEEIGIGEPVKLTVEMDNKSPCITFDSDIIPIIDISGSMFGQRITDAKNAAITFVDLMSDNNHKIGLTSYSNDGYLNHTLTFNYNAVKNEINSLSLVDMTCISCGIKISNILMDDYRRPNTAAYHVLMTDGVANYCLVPDSCTLENCLGQSCTTAVAEAETRNMAYESKDTGITIYTIGFAIASGSAAEQLMIDVAEITGGKYFHAPTGEELEQVYKTIAGLIIGYSLNTKILIEIPDNFQFTGWDSGCNLVNGDLECYVGDLPCGSGAGDIAFDFTVEALSGDSGDEVEIIATVLNEGGQKKEAIETIRIRGALTVSNLNFGFPDPCGQSRIPNFYWDIDTNESYDYQIEICRQANCENVLVDGIQGVHGSNITGWTPNCTRCCPVYSQVEFGGETYWGRLRVKDVNSEHWSSWIEAGFSTFQNCWPSPSFDWEPEYPAVDQIVEFYDDSRCYNQDGGVIECSGWSWTFENGNPGFSTDRNPTVSFSTMEPSGNQATLLSCDNVSVQGGPYCCPRSENINVRHALPRWREIAPF